MTNQVQRGRPRRRSLDIPATLTVSDLATLLDVDPVDIIKEFMRAGYMYTINQVIDHEMAGKIAVLAGYEVGPLQERQSPASLVLTSEGEAEEDLEVRPPVVTILGHVDHGKTTLLDHIRNANVVDREAGGITQHIGAYQIMRGDGVITFIDTPGHEAFTEMRARGAKVTDFAVLVVAADDGIMPQTIEAINHVRSADVPIIVAINKIDRPDADLERVKRQLAEQELLIEEWGGDVIAVPVSALSGQGVEDLLDNIQVVAEVSELQANPTRLAQGIVIESRVDKSMGTVATVLVQTGTLKVGDSIVVGEIRGRIRAMFSDKGSKVSTAGPSQPVEITGLSGLPSAGDVLEAMEGERAARSLAESRKREREADIFERRGVTLEEIHRRMETGGVRELNLIVKTDVQGSVDAVRAALEAVNTDRTRVNFVHLGTGTITESDVMLASAANAVILGFNSGPGAGAGTLARLEGVQVRQYNIIYELIDDVQKALEGLLEPEITENLEGRAVVRATFSVGRRRTAAGFFVTNGRVLRSSTIRVLRGRQPLFEGAITSLKHFQEDVREVANGFEGGIVLEGYNDFQEEDVLESFTLRES
jgi:translation initiation factor IF-2